MLISHKISLSLPRIRQDLSTSYNECKHKQPPKVYMRIAENRLQAKRCLECGGELLTVNITIWHKVKYCPICEDIPAWE